MAEVVNALLEMGPEHTAKLRDALRFWVAVDKTKTVDAAFQLMQASKV